MILIHLPSSILTVFSAVAIANPDSSPRRVLWANSSRRAKDTLGTLFTCEGAKTHPERLKWKK